MPRSLFPLVLGALAAIGFLALHMIVQKIMAPGQSLRADLQKGNAARAMLEVGHITSVFLIAASAVANCGDGEDFKKDAIWIGAFGAAGIAVGAVVARLGMRTLLRSKLDAEIARGNVAAGIAAASHLVATGLLVSRAFGGSDLNSLGISLVFFAIAQLSLHGLVLLFRALTVYDDDEEIIGENVAAALSYAGATLAIAIVIGHAVEGQFSGWSTSLIAYAQALLLSVALWPVRQVVIQGLLVGGAITLRGGALDDGIAKKRNVGLGALEAGAYVATALLVTRVGLRAPRRARRPRRHRHRPVARRRPAPVGDARLPRRHAGGSARARRRRPRLRVPRGLSAGRGAPFPARRLLWPFTGAEGHVAGVGAAVARHRAGRCVRDQRGAGGDRAEQRHADW